MKKTCLIKTIYLGFLWSEWSDHICNATCGNGAIIRNRVCINPSTNATEPDFKCKGASSESVACDHPVCPGKVSSDYSQQILPTDKWPMDFLTNPTLVSKHYHFPHKINSW